MAITKKEINSILGFASSHCTYIPGSPTHVSKIQAFLSIFFILKGNLYWYALKFAYQCSDDLYYYRYDILRAFSSSEPFRTSLMSAREKRFLERLPEKITIYRGMTLEEFDDGDYGVSWTLKKEKAEYFAYEYVRNHSTKDMEKTVCEKIINKSEVIAYWDSRKEFEIIYIDKGRIEEYVLSCSKKVIEF